MSVTISNSNLAKRGINYHLGHARCFLPVSPSFLGPTSLAASRRTGGFAADALFFDLRVGFPNLLRAECERNPRLDHHNRHVQHQESEADENRKAQHGTSFRHNIILSRYSESIRGGKGTRFALSMRMHENRVCPI